MIKSKNISVIIVSFNNEKTIEACLSSLRKNEPGVEIIVVDNNSEDKTKEIVSRYSSVKLIASDQNLGFSKGCNKGVKAAEGDYLVFLNPDTKLLAPGQLSQMVEYLAENPDFGAIGPKLLHQDGSLHKTARNLPTFFRAFKEYLLGMKGQYDFYVPAEGQISAVESIIGACFVISREVFQKVKGFDERYFLYYEDLQLSKDIGELNLKIAYDPSLKIQHIEGASGVRQKTNIFLQQSARIYHTPVEYWALQSLLLLVRIINKVKELCSL